MPFWHVAGFALGGNSHLGAARRHGLHRRGRGGDRPPLLGAGWRLDETEAELRDTIETFRAEELEHRDIGLEHGAERRRGRLLKAAITVVSGIALSERVLRDLALSLIERFTRSDVSPRAISLYPLLRTVACDRLAHLRGVARPTYRLARSRLYPLSESGFTRSDVSPRAISLYPLSESNSRAPTYRLARSRSNTFA